jgi:hypothetical protein
MPSRRICLARVCTSSGIWSSDIEGIQLHSCFVGPGAFSADVDAPSVAEIVMIVTMLLVLSLLSQYSTVCWLAPSQTSREPASIYLLHRASCPLRSQRDRNWHR